MGVSYFIGILLAAVSMRVAAPCARLPRLSDRAVFWAVGTLATGLVFAQVAALRITDGIALAAAVPAWQRALPLAVFLGSSPFGSTGVHGVGTVVQLLTFVQSGLLLALWSVLRTVDARSGTARRLAPIVAIAAIVMAATAFLANVGGPDVYAYVAFGLAANPYLPDGFAHAGPAIANVWGHHAIPSPYGPAWTLLSRALMAVPHDLAGRLFAFRALGLVAMTIAIAALASARRFVTAALFALDPALWQLYVSEAHNDIVGIALLLVAFACRRYPYVAIGLVAIAGAVKLPFLAIGVVVFASAPTLRERIVPAAVATLLGVWLSLVFGGAPYLAAMRRTTELYAHQVGGYEWTSHLVLGAIGLGSLATVVLLRRFFWGASWSFVAFGQYTAWQYLGWAIPYAILDETRGAFYLAMLPVTGYEVTLFFDNTPLFTASRIALIALTLGALLLSFRRANPARTSLVRSPAR